MPLPRRLILAGLAATLYLPTDTILSAQGVDSGVPHFLRYQDLTDKIVFSFTASGRPFPWLSLGLGLQMLTDVTSKVKIGIDALGSTFTRQDINVGIVPKLGALAGMMIRPLPNLGIGLTYRQQLAINFSVPAEITLGDALDLALDVDGIVGFSPHTVELGLSYLLPRPDIEIALQASWERWSRMPESAPRIDLNIGGTLLEDLGLVEASASRNSPLASCSCLASSWTSARTARAPS